MNLALKIKEIGLFLFLIGVIFSCDPLPCLDKRAPELRIDLARDSSGIILPAQLAVDSLFVIYPETKLKLVSSRAVISAIRFRVPFQTESFLISAFDSLRKDSILFSYQKQAFFVSEECGYKTIFTHLGSTNPGGELFSTVQILNDQVDTSSVTNARIILP